MRLIHPTVHTAFFYFYLLSSASDFSRRFTQTPQFTLMTIPLSRTLGPTAGECVSARLLCVITLLNDTSRKRWCPLSTEQHDTRTKPPTPPPHPPPHGHHGPAGTCGRSSSCWLHSSSHLQASHRPQRPNHSGVCVSRGSHYTAVTRPHSRPHTHSSQLERVPFTTLIHENLTLMIGSNLAFPRNQ